MTYQVLARKWRPLSFDEVINQDHVKTTLINAVGLKRIAHAYIFAGPRGVGKTTMARIFARALNCEKGPTPTPCNSCSPCTEIIEDRSMDVMEIDGASNRGIEDVRNIRDNVKYAPIHGKYRIYIIDEVHMLTREAFNALLKTLEEPPAHVLFIFATTEFQKIPATILSRCQRFDFKRISVPDIVAQLRKICTAEKITIADDSLTLLARRSEGSIRDAESLLDQLVSFCGNTVGADDVFDIIGMIREDVYFTCSDAVTEGDLSQAFVIARKIFDDGYDPGEFVSGLLEHFRNMLLVHLTGNADMIESSDYFQKKYLESSQRFSENDIIRIINTISEAEYQIRKSSQPLLKMELLLVKLTAMDRSVTIDQILETIDRGEKEKPPEGVTGRHPSIPEIGTHQKQEEPETPPGDENAAVIRRKESPDGRDGSGKNDEPPRKNAEHSLTLDDIKNRWKEFVETVRAENVLTGSFLREGEPTGLNDMTLQLSFHPESDFTIHSLERNRVKVNRFLHKVFGANIGFECIKKKSPAADRELALKKTEPESVQERLQKILRREPIIQTIIDTFGAVSVKLRLD